MDIRDIKFFPFTICERNCVINRQIGENLFLLTDFSDAKPLYDSENGLHLKLQSKKDSEPIIIRLSDSIAHGIYIEDWRKMSKEEHHRTFLSKKQSVIEHLTRKTYAKGFENPSAVQALTIVELIRMKDCIIQFKSGEGKTHAFLFGTLWHFDPLDEKLQAIFITSSHEVAQQIYSQAQFLLSDIPIGNDKKMDAKICLSIGRKKETGISGGFKTPIGTSSISTRNKQIQQEKADVGKAQIIIGTMGKVHDYLCNKKDWVDLRYLKTLCIDEFDHIVTSGSRSRSSTQISTELQLKMIINKIPENTQRVFVSATVTRDALHTSYDYFRKYTPDIGEPLIILLNLEDGTVEGIRQYYVECSDYREKEACLIDLLGQLVITQAIIFVNTKVTAMAVKNSLDQQQFPISSAVFHSDLTAEARDRVFADFRENRIRLLISTDIASRGLDIISVNLVINYDMPDRLESYIHRIGRCGRYGRKGLAISFILVNSTENEMAKVKEINESSERCKMEPLPCPNDLEQVGQFLIN